MTINLTTFEVNAIRTAKTCDLRNKRSELICQLKLHSNACMYYFYLCFAGLLLFLRSQVLVMQIGNAPTSDICKLVCSLQEKELSKTCYVL